VYERRRRVWRLDDGGKNASGNGLYGTFTHLLGTARKRSTSVIVKTCGDCALGNETCTCKPTQSRILYHI
jgi:hypothetical protein